MLMRQRQSRLAKYGREEQCIGGAKLMVVLVDRKPREPSHAYAALCRSVRIGIRSRSGVLKSWCLT